MWWCLTWLFSFVFSLQDRAFLTHPCSRQQERVNNTIEREGADLRSLPTQWVRRETIQGRGRGVGRKPAVASVNYPPICCRQSGYHFSSAFSPKYPSGWKHAPCECELSTLKLFCEHGYGLSWNSNHENHIDVICLCDHLFIVAGPEKRAPNERGESANRAWTRKRRKMRNPPISLCRSIFVPVRTSKNENRLG